MICSRPLAGDRPEIQGSSRQTEGRQQVLLGSPYNDTSIVYGVCLPFAYPPSESGYPHGQRTGKLEAPTCSGGHTEARRALSPRAPGSSPTFDGLPWAPLFSTVLGLGLGRSLRCPPASSGSISSRCPRPFPAPFICIRVTPGPPLRLGHGLGPRSASFRKSAPDHGQTPSEA